MDEIEELEQLASQARAKKGRMDADSRAKASSLVAAIWGNPDVDPKATIELLENLQSEAIAEGISSSWAKMNHERQLIIKRWIGTVTSERAYRRLALVAGAVINNDGGTALEWLGALIPKGRKSVNKESRQVLASVLFGDKPIRFESIAYEGAPFSEVMRIYSALFDIVTDHSLSIGAMTRSRLAAAIFSFVAKTDGSQNGSVNDLEEKVLIDMKKWPTALREQFQKQVQVLQPPIQEKTRPELVPVRNAEGHAISSAKAPSVQRSEEFNKIQEDMESCISTLAGGFELLRSLQSAIKSRFDYISQSERELEVTRERVLALEVELRRIADDRDAIRRDLQRANERVSELTSTVERLGSDADAERRRLGQQIAANAAGRIEEFKNRLGLTLSRLIVDLPEADSLVSSELGKILLLQFHQFLDALGQEGVETRPGVRSR
jgi:hypothetical protein